MADRHNPNDAYRAGRSEEEMRRRDNELQADPQLAEGPASGGRIAPGISILRICPMPRGGRTLQDARRGDGCMPI